MSADEILMIMAVAVGTIGCALIALCTILYSISMFIMRRDTNYTISDILLALGVMSVNIIMTVVGLDWLFHHIV